MNLQNLKNALVTGTKVTKMMMAILIISIVTISCGKDDPVNNGNNNNQFQYDRFNIKAATIVYSNEDDNGEFKIVFDDYGKKFRHEMSDQIVISDEDAKKYYVLIPAEKKYLEYSSEAGASNRYLFLYYGDDVGSAWSYYPGFIKQSNRTIAGKNCSVCKWGADGETFEWGGWSRITFLHSVVSGSDVSKFEAKSIVESAPANSFTIPDDYTKY